MDRDWLEWAVDIGALLGGMASLAAVLLAVLGLREAAELRWIAHLDRARDRVHRRLELLQDVGRLVAKLGTSLDMTDYGTAHGHHRELGVLLNVGALVDVLPKTAAVAFAPLPREGNEMRSLGSRVLVDLVNEIGDVIGRTHRELLSIPQVDAKRPRLPFVD